MIHRNAKEEYLGGEKEFTKVALSTYMRGNYSNIQCPRGMSISNSMKAVMVQLSCLKIISYLHHDPIYYICHYATLYYHN